MDIIEHYRIYLVINEQFSCKSVLLWRPIWPKRTQKWVYGDGIFLFAILLKHLSPIYRVLHLSFDASDVPMQHLCITAQKYGGLCRTFYDTVYSVFVDFSPHTSAKIKNGRQVVV